MNNHATNQRPKKERLLISLLFLTLHGCGLPLVYKDKFNGGSLGLPPQQPTVGSSVVSGHVVIDELNDISPNKLLKLKRQLPAGPLAVYEGTFDKVIRNGTISLTAYIPSDAPNRLRINLLHPTQDFSIASIQFTAQRSIWVTGSPPILDNGIQFVNAFKMDRAIPILIGVDLDSTPSTVSVSIRGFEEDVDTTVQVAGSGVGRIKIQTTWGLGENPPPGENFVDDILVWGN